jgi:hypothetical protein
MLEEEAGNQLMWRTEPQPNSLSTGTRLMNILEAKHRWKSGAPTRPCTSSSGRKGAQRHQPAGEVEDQEHELSGDKFAGGMAPVQVLPPDTDASHPSKRHTISSTHSAWARSG